MAFNLIINPVKGGNPAKAINKIKNDPDIGLFDVRSMIIIE
jgi:hypothetical protein